MFGNFLESQMFVNSLSINMFSKFGVHIMHTILQTCAIPACHRNLRLWRLVQILAWMVIWCFHSSEFELAVLKADLLQSQKAAYADSTQKMHKMQWKTYIKFCLYFEREIFPASAETVCLYAQFLSRSLNSPRSIANYVAAVKILHTLLDKSTEGFTSFEVKLTIRGISRLRKHLVQQAAPSHLNCCLTYFPGWI